MAPRRSSSFRDIVLVLLAVTVAWGGPRLVRAWGALQWTRYHAAQAPDAGGQHAREEARWAEKTLQLAAPLPWGATACRLALDFGLRQEVANPAAAQELYDRMQQALEAMSQSRWRGLGLAHLLEEARGRGEAQRARTAAPSPVP